MNLKLIWPFRIYLVLWEPPFAPAITNISHLLLIQEAELKFIVAIK